MAEETKTGKQEPLPVRIVNDSLPTEDVGSDELGTFERRTLRYSQWTLAVAFLALVAAVGTGIVFWYQFKEMATQTGILAATAQQAKQDSAESAVNTSKQLVIARQQAKAAQDSAAAIQRQMRVDQRAWIRPITPLTADIELVVNQPITVKFQYRNLGKTPAKNIDGPVFVEVVKKEESPKLVKLFTRERPVLPHGYGFSQLIVGVLYPDGLMTSIITRERGVNGKTEEWPLSVAEYGDLMAGRAYLAFHGGLGYRDVFGVQHWTTFCSWYSYAPGTYAASKCSTYNKTDNN